LFRSFLDKRILVSESLKESLEIFLEIVGVPVDRLRIGDDNALEGIDSLLSKLCFWAFDAILNVQVYYFINVLKGLEIRQNTVV